MKVERLVEGEETGRSLNLCYVCMKDGNFCAVMSTLKYMWFVLLHSEGEAPNLLMVVCSSDDT